MPAQSFAEHRVPVPGSNETLKLSQRLHSGEFLAPWSYMDPDVQSVTWSGPTWVYESNGRDRSTSIPLTVLRRSSRQVEYWDVVDDRRGVPASVAVKRARSELEGRPYVLFDTRFINSHPVELWNRRTGYFILAQAKAELLDPVEVDVLVATERRDVALKELVDELPHSDGLVRAAVMNLWRKGRLQVPAAERLFGNSWVIRRVSHVGH